MSLYDLGDVVTLTFTVYDANGQAADAGAVAAPVVTAPDGTTLATSGVAHTNGTGIYTVTCTPALLGSHKVAWTATGTNAQADTYYFDVYGATVATPTQLKARDPDLASKSDAVLRAKLRDAVQQWNELAKVAMAPFGTRLTRIGDGRSVMLLPDVEVRRIVSLTIDGTTISSTAYTVDASGVLRLLAGSFTLNKTVVVYFEHGLDAPPGAVVDAVLMRAMELLVAPLSGSGRTTVQANELGFNRLSIAGRDGTTGLPDFDATAALFGRQGAVGFA